VQLKCNCPVQSTSQWSGDEEREVTFIRDSPQTLTTKTIFILAFWFITDKIMHNTVIYIEATGTGAVVLANWRWFSPSGWCY